MFGIVRQWAAISSDSPLVTRPFYDEAEVLAWLAEPKNHASRLLIFRRGSGHCVPPALDASSSAWDRSRFPLLRTPLVKIPRKTIRYECVGGPRDGDVVLIQRTKQHAELDGALYHVRVWTKMDEHGQRLLWKREALVWEGLLVSDATDQPTSEPTPPQPVDWPIRDG